MAAQPASEAAMQTALLGHDRVRQSTQLAQFFGRKEKDTVTPYVLSARIAKAAPIAGWNTDERKSA
jgi:hypothetical protein